MRTSLLLLLVLVPLIACGGGGGTPTSTADPGIPPAPTNPEVVLLLVSGHTVKFDSNPSLSYLHEFLGPKLVADLEDSGYWVDTLYYVDHPIATDANGYDGLLTNMRWIRDNWVRGQQRPTKVVMIAHSHGGVWATAAIRQVSDLTISLQVALDHSSYGWGTVGHTEHDAVMGGDPRDEYYIEALASCPTDGDTWNESSYWYDLEDVVFPNVRRALEVQSGEPVVWLEPFDEKWNVRLNGTLDRMSCYYAGTSHYEVRSTSGSTYPVVLNFLLTHLDE